jgi:hypothetical protein
MADMANMADTANTADIMANTANILARCRREADTSSAEAGRRGGKWSGRNWSGGNWSGDWWHHRFSGDRFIFSGGFGYPYYWNRYPGWGWSVPYAFNYGYYSYGYYPSYWYDYDYYCSISRKRFFGP